ncbi:disease resistance protein RPP13-like [Miscanthus floridulus]|uniref:disease resistance protein RPP13-like n=1 Tax=Miscanthus floridulus TaxID=154761 RepID=UPI0034588CB9
MTKLVELFSKAKARRDIAAKIKDITKRLEDVANNRQKYKLDEIMCKPLAATSTIDPRLKAIKFLASAEAPNFINQWFFHFGVDRYFIVIDDVWEVRTWEAIKLALVENNHGSKVITTTRNIDVAKASGEVYKLKQLSYDDSMKLFYTRLSRADQKFLDNHPDDISEKILKKCAGIPLAIITMASLLAGKPESEWSMVYNSIGFHTTDNREAEDTMTILSFSYYDLPPHLRTCLLYLSTYPEDYKIEKDLLIWKWIAEGFIDGKQGTRLFELGERYFNDLINRSLI